MECANDDFHGRDTRVCHEVNFSCLALGGKKQSSEEVLGESYLLSVRSEYDGIYAVAVFGGNSIADWISAGPIFYRRVRPSVVSYTGRSLLSIHLLKLYALIENQEGEGPLYCAFKVCTDF